MKLLFDENVAASLVLSLADVYPGSAHLQDVGLEGANDSVIWDHAAREGYAIVTKDDDFRALSVLHGSPPKLLMITLGNCRTSAVEQVLRSRHREIEAFNADGIASLMEIP